MKHSFPIRRASDLNDGMAEELHNPKLDEHPGSTTEKNPHDWVSGDDPMTGAQASYLTTLCKEAGAELPPESLTKAEASERLDVLKTRIRSAGRRGGKAGIHKGRRGWSA